MLRLVQLHKFCFCCVRTIFEYFLIIFQVHSKNRCMYMAIWHSLNVRSPGYLQRDLVYYPNRYLRCHVVMYMVQHRVLFLHTHKLYLLGQYTGTGGDLWPFSYKGYLLHMLDNNSRGDHLVLHTVSMMWAVLDLTVVQ